MSRYVYNYKGVDSAIEELDYAVVHLTDGCTNNKDCGFDYAAGEASRISENLAPANGTLSAGWARVSDTCLKLHEQLKELFDTLYCDIQEFINETTAAEQKAIDAVETANQASDDILKELGIAIEQ